MIFGRTDNLFGTQSYFNSFIYTKTKQKPKVNETNSCINKISKSEISKMNLSSANFFK